MRHLRNKNILFALSWLALALALTASADVVEDLVFESEQAENGDASLPASELESPAENTMMPSHRIALSPENSHTGQLVASGAVHSLLVNTPLGPVSNRATAIPGISFRHLPSLSLPSLRI